MLKRNENVSVITANHSEKAQAGLKTKQSPALFLYTEGISETLGQKKVESERKGNDISDKY